MSFVFFECQTPLCFRLLDSFYSLQLSRSFLLIIYMRVLFLQCSIAVLGTVLVSKGNLASCNKDL